MKTIRRKIAIPGAFALLLSNTSILNTKILRSKENIRSK